jgi:hypothetical protein
MINERDLLVDRGRDRVDDLGDIGGDLTVIGAAGVKATIAQRADRLREMS